MNRLPTYAPILVRITIALVLAWFGYNQIANPQMWLRVVPEWGASLFGTAATAVAFNGWFEIVLAAVLLVGTWVRWAGLVAAVHIAVIASGFGLSPTGVRDLGLTLAAFAIFLYGSDAWSLDAYRARRRAARAAGSNPQ